MFAATFAGIGVWLWNKPHRNLSEETASFSGTSEELFDHISSLNDSGRLARINSTIELEGAVLGTVNQIDIFKNGRLQFAFATPNRVYVIDRDGKDAAGIQVPGDATKLVVTEMFCIEPGAGINGMGNSFI